MTKGKRRGFVLIAVSIIAGFIFLWNQTSPTGIAEQKLKVKRGMHSEQEFEVKRGMHSKEVVEQLYKQGLIKNILLTELIFYQLRMGEKLREGFFTLSGDMGPFQIAQVLESPPHFPFVYVLIPEGKRLTEVVESVVMRGLSNRSELKSSLRQQQGYSVYTQGKRSLEGFLFPAKYNFLLKTRADEIVRTMIDRSMKELTLERIDQAKKQGLSPYQWVTLASLVQAEAGSTNEMPRIAGVFLNRLRSGMRLQSDPTVAYGLGLALPELDRSRGDFEKMTDYNTYMRTGLPPTPIGNPGRDALLAVLHPILTIEGKDAYYFLHGQDGRLHVNSTFDGHRRDNLRYR